MASLSSIPFFRRSSAIAVALVAAYTVLVGLVHAQHDRLSFALVANSWGRSEIHALMELVGLTLLALSTRLWRGLRAAVWIAGIATGLLAVAALVNSDYLLAVMAAGLIAVLAIARSSFTLARDDQPTWTALYAAIAAWMLAYGALITAQSVTGTITRLAGRFEAGFYWPIAVELLTAIAAATSVAAVRTLLRPSARAGVQTPLEYDHARMILARHGTDSLSPFLLRPDKALLFAAGGVLSYKVINNTAIVSGDPVGPDGCAASLLAEMLELAGRRGWHLAVWGASDRHLSAYQDLGLHALHAGDEAVVDPARFTLDGRTVRKLRQSVHRVERRGWQIESHEGRLLDQCVEDEIEALEQVWRSGQSRILGYAMSMAAFDTQVGPDDLYLLARAPDGELRACMRFACHCGKLSLDTMRRLPGTPNGLNEALVARALSIAGDRGVREVSLNYAGLAHVVRRQSGPDKRGRVAERLLLRLAGRRFQLETLVRFNEKFSPEWRPRYLVYDSRVGLPRTVLRVLRAEGYLSTSESAARRWSRRRGRVRAGSGNDREITGCLPR